MKTKNFLYLICFYSVLSFAVPYIGGAFISASFDVSSWELELRKGIGTTLRVDGLLLDGDLKSANLVNEPLSHSTSADPPSLSFRANAPIIT